MRVQRHPGFHPQAMYQLQGPVQVRGGFDVNGQYIRTGIPEGLRIALRLQDHQVYIEGFWV